MLVEWMMDEEMPYRTRGRVGRADGNTEVESTSSVARCMCHLLEVQFKKKTKKSRKCLQTQMPTASTTAANQALSIQ